MEGPNQSRGWSSSVEGCSCNEQMSPPRITLTGWPFVVRQRTASKAEVQVDDRARLHTDDECVQKLAALIEHKHNRNLSETARLIGRPAAAQRAGRDR